jgi:membrane associated rhomboid family serine protease
MAGLSGTLLALLAGALCYVASPRQQLLRTPARARDALFAAALCMVGACALWCSAAGAVAGPCAAVGALAAGLALMPFVGAYWQHEAHARKPRAKRAASGNPETL